MKEFIHSLLKSAFFDMCIKHVYVSPMSDSKSHLNLQYLGFLICRMVNIKISTIPEYICEDKNRYLYGLLTINDVSLPKAARLSFNMSPFFNIITLTTSIYSVSCE